MSYTNLDLIRHHLVAAFPTQARIYDQPLVFESDDYLSFYGAAVEASSLLVKSIQSHQPSRSVLTLNGTSTDLATSPLVPGSVVVASDGSLGRVYMENVDYSIEYAQAKMTIKSNGSLAVGQTVVAWFQTYALYSHNSDYRLNADGGEIKRLAGGDIVVGETVYLDYSPVWQAYNEDVLNAAVVEANGLIEREVDPEGQFGADPTLQAAATYRALEIVCRTSAVRALAAGRGEDRTALAWMKLADVFETRSDHLLAAFRPRLGGLNPPARA